MGFPAKTSFAIASIAIKYDALIIPAYALRKNENLVEIQIDPSITLSNPSKIMAELNLSLESIITKNPSQWYWIHNRWK